jgi:hypothetical protein
MAEENDHDLVPAVSTPTRLNGHTCTTRPLLLTAGIAASLAMVLLGVGESLARSGPSLAQVPLSVVAGHAGAPLAPGDSGGEVTRGNESGSFAPTSTNDLITPFSPAPGSPWRD